MKILIAVLLLAVIGAGSCALDLKGLFRRASGNRTPEAPPAVPAPGDSKPADRDFPPSIKPEEARRLIESGEAVVIDIRTAQEHAAARIAPTHMTLDYYAPDFSEKLKALDRDARYLLYCRSGNRTGSALRMMKDLGFTRSHDIDGGINAWIKAGLPVAK